MALALSGCGGDSAKSETQATAGDNVAVADNTAQGTPYVGRERFALRDVDGHLRKWSEFAGKPVVINFWATWCGPCRREIPVLKRLYAEYNPRGVEIIGMSTDQQTRSNVVPFVKQMEIPWVVIYADRGATQEFGLGRSIPMTLFINAEGVETGRVTGAQPEQVFRQEFEKLFE